MASGTLRVASVRSKDFICIFEGVIDPLTHKEKRMYCSLPKDSKKVDDGRTTTWQNSHIKSDGFCNLYYTQDNETGRVQYTVSTFKLIIIEHE